MSVKNVNNFAVSMAVIERTLRESAKEDKQGAQKTRSTTFRKAINNKKKAAEMTRAQADKDVGAQEEEAEGQLWEGIWGGIGAIAAIAVCCLAAPLAIPAVITGGILGGIGLAAGAGMGLSRWQASSDSAELKAEAAEFQELAAKAELKALEAQNKADKAKQSAGTARDRMREALAINRNLLSYENTAFSEITKGVGSGGRA